jgi:hypothetical protein
MISERRRRFPLPWSIEEQARVFVVRDHSGLVVSRTRLFVRVFNFQSSHISV